MAINPSVLKPSPSSFHPANDNAECKVNLIISLDLAVPDHNGINAGSIYFALYDRRFQAVLTTRRIVQLRPELVGNSEIPWANRTIMEIYTDTKTEDLFLFLVKHGKERDSAAYYGFDPGRLKLVSNEAFKKLLSQPSVKLPDPKGTVDDLMDLFATAAKIKRRVLWFGHGFHDAEIAGLTCQDFLKTHHRLNLMRPEIEGVVSCYVGGKHRLAIARTSHAHPVILFGSEDVEGYTAFCDVWKGICANLDRQPTQMDSVEDIRALMPESGYTITDSVEDEPQVILPFKRGVRLINPKFIFVTPDTRYMKVPRDKLAALYTSYIAQTLRFKQTDANWRFFYSQIAGDAHHLFEEVQLPKISWDEFLKALTKSWIPSCRVKAFFIKKLSFSDVNVENVILTNADNTTQMIYRLVNDCLASYFIYRHGEEIQEIDPFSYFFRALQILKDSKPSEEAVKLATETSEEPSVYPRIKRCFLIAHKNYMPFEHIFRQFDEPKINDPATLNEIAALTIEQRHDILTLAHKYNCQPLLLALHQKIQNKSVK